MPKTTNSGTARVCKKIGKAGYGPGCQNRLFKEKNAQYEEEDFYLDGFPAEG